MITYLLKRIALTDKGTFGVLIDENNIPFCLTLERPWLNNQHDVSCIPAGTYNCVKGFHQIHGFVYQVMNVPNRDEILIHVGNTIDDTEGCILVGEAYGYNLKNGNPGVASSTPAFNLFMQKLSGQTQFSLRIMEV